MQVNEIKLSEIATSALNPRKTFDETELKELAQSIEANGLIQSALDFIYLHILVLISSLGITATPFRLWLLWALQAA